jgi:hypothetical protein
MGTRNLTIVKLDNKTRVAQYGQWDGYPTGQGQTIADFFKNVDLRKFKEAVKKLKSWKKEDIKKAYASLGITGEWLNSEQAQQVHNKYPEFNRDHGAGILELIYNGTVKKVVLDEDFKNDGTFCEYYYTIDLDKETISVNDGKNYTFEQWTRKGLMHKLEKE